VGEEITDESLPKLLIAERPTHEMGKEGKCGAKNTRICGQRINAFTRDALRSEKKCQFHYQILIERLNLHHVSCQTGWFKEKHLF
jgi:hypothetical protein